MLNLKEDEILNNLESTTLNTNPLPTFIDLFSGCGGLSLGFLQAGYQCLLAVDNDPKAVYCYNLNLKGDTNRGAVQEDLSGVSSINDVYAFLKFHNIDSTPCDVLIGGPPCQSFSIVGRNKIRSLMEASDDHKLYWLRKNYERTTFFEVYALFLEALTPRWFLFENVPAIRNHKIFEAIINRFENLHAVEYELTYDNYLASKFGVPQNRRRFILVGYRKDLKVKDWKLPKEQSIVTVLDALDDLPKVPHGHREQEMQYSSAPITAYQRLMRAREPHNHLFDHVCRRHNPDDVALFARMKPGARFADLDVQRAIREINPHHRLIKYSTSKFKDKLRKLNPKEPAWTVTAHLQKDCYMFIHYEQPRTITVREAARLQSFPDWFRFKGLPMGVSFRLIGDAVPPLMAQAFAESFIETDFFK